MMTSWLWSPTPTLQPTPQPEVQAFLRLPLEESLLKAMEAEAGSLRRKLSRVRAPFGDLNGAVLLLGERQRQLLQLLDLNKLLTYARAELCRQRRAKEGGEQRLAFAMLLHPLLGADARELPREVVREIGTQHYKHYYCYDDYDYDYDYD
jgi:hypothetical protein